MRGFWAALSAGLVVAPALALGQGPPPGWRFITDRQPSCQLAVPGDWTGPASLARAAGGTPSAVVHALSRGQNWDEAMSTARKVMRPVKTFEDTPKRLFYSYEANGGASQKWYVAIPGNGTICTAQIEFRDPAFETTARTIVFSLSPVK